MSALAILARLRAVASVRYFSMPIDWSQPNSNKKLLVSKTFRMFALTVLARLRSVASVRPKKGIPLSLSIQATTALSRKTEMHTKIFGEKVSRNYLDITIRLQNV